MTRVDGRPDPLALLRDLAREERRRAALRVYLGYERGCGTTTAMLDEARRRRGRGTDVVVGAYRVHGAAAEALRELEVVGVHGVPPPALALDVDAVLARNPDVACVDDLAERDRSGPPRVEAVPRLLAAGITVLATLHVRSLRSVAEGMAGAARPPAVIDDAVLASIDEIELIDLPPADLIERIRAGGVLTPAQLAIGLQRELRPAVLALLRETALRVIADHSDRQLVGLLRASPPRAAPEVRTRVVCCLPPVPGREASIRFAATYAAAQDGELAVATVRPRRPTDQQRRQMGAYATLTHQLGGEFVRLAGRDVAASLAEFIRGRLATEVILGHRRRMCWRPWDTTSELIRRLEGVDVHILRAPPPG